MTITTQQTLGEALRFTTAVRTTASPQEVYDVLADLSTHEQWGGRESAMKGQALIAVQAPPGPATVGTTFSSTGRSGKDTFHDSSTVTAASPATHFGFRTQARLERAHGPEWHVVFVHDYRITDTREGTTVSYTCSVNPLNYVPYWLKPVLKHVTHRMVNRLMTKNLRNLARLAES